MLSVHVLHPPQLVLSQRHALTSCHHGQPQRHAITTCHLFDYKGCTPEQRGDEPPRHSVSEEWSVVALFSMYGQDHSIVSMSCHFGPSSQHAITAYIATACHHGMSPQQKSRRQREQITGKHIVPPRSPHNPRTYVHNGRGSMKSCIIEGYNR